MPKGLQRSYDKRYKRLGLTSPAEAHRMLLFSEVSILYIDYYSFSHSHSYVLRAYFHLALIYLLPRSHLPWNLKNEKHLGKD